MIALPEESFRISVYIKDDLQEKNLWKNVAGKKIYEKIPNFRDLKVKLNLIKILLVFK